MDEEDLGAAWAALRMVSAQASTAKATSSICPPERPTWMPLRESSVCARASISRKPRHQASKSLRSIDGSIYKKRPPGEGG